MKVERPGIASREAVLSVVSKAKGGSLYLIISILHGPSISLERLLKDSVPEGPLGKKEWKLHSPQIPILSLLLSQV